MPCTKYTNTRTKVQCFCKNCNSLLVDPRTKQAHMSKRNKSYDYQEARPSNNPGLYDDIEMDDNEMECDYTCIRNYLSIKKIRNSVIL